MRYLIFILVFSFLSTAYGLPSRITIDKFDRSKVKKIYISYGKVQVIEFPDFVEEKYLGLPGLFKVVRSKNQGNQLIIKMLENTSNSTNLFVQTRNNDKYIIDLVPDATNHQDLYEIDDSFFGSKENVISDAKQTVAKKLMKRILKRKYRKAINKKINIKVKKIKKPKMSLVFSREVSKL